MHGTEQTIAAMSSGKNTANALFDVYWYILVYSSLNFNLIVLIWFVLRLLHAVYIFVCGLFIACRQNKYHISSINVRWTESERKKETKTPSKQQPSNDGNAQTNTNSLN